MTKSTSRTRREEILAEWPIYRQLEIITEQMELDRLGGKKLHQDADDMISSILAIKEKHPKPKKVNPKK